MAGSCHPTSVAASVAACNLDAPGELRCVDHVVLKQVEQVQGEALPHLHAAPQLVGMRLDKVL